MIKRVQPVPGSSQATQSLCGSSLELEFYKRMYENEQNTTQKTPNKIDSTCDYVVCFTVCSLLHLASSRLRDRRVR